MQLPLPFQERAQNCRKKKIRVPPKLQQDKKDPTTDLSNIFKLVPPKIRPFRFPKLFPRFSCNK